VLVKNLHEPFHHSIIYDFYEPWELKEILVEINSLDAYFRPSAETGDPRANDKMCAIHMDTHYKDNREKSYVLNFNRKLFYLQEQLKDNPFAGYLPYTNHDVTQVNYYGNGAVYDHHADHGTLSAVTVLWKEPKAFEGGDLEFTDFGYKPTLKNNTTILFPSFLQHSVSRCIGSGRYSINQFYFINR